MLSTLKQEEIEDVLTRIIEVGLIIGRESSGFFGKWLGDYNDGYIEMKDVAFPAAKDKILIPITHNELNKRIGTARYIHNFISRGNLD